MYRLTLLTLFLFVYGLTEATMPQELRKILGIGEDSKDMQSSLSNLKDDLKKDPGTFMGKDFNLGKYISQGPSNMASIEAARRQLDAGDVEMYRPTRITAAECHVEYQVTERVPGRCIRLPGSMPACQGEKYIGINYNECS